MNKTEQIIYEIAKKFISPATVYGISSSDVGLMVRAISALFDDMYEGEFVEWLLNSDWVYNDNGLFGLEGSDTFTNLVTKEYTLPELRQYWLDNIKK